jgi:hypothetical protein
LRVGYPSSIEIEAGSENSIYVEVNNPNSLVYIGFATMLNDITFHLLKYIASDEEAEKQARENKETPAVAASEDDENITDKGHFRTILKLERVDSSINPIKVRQLALFLFCFFFVCFFLIINFEFDFNSNQLVMFVKEPGTYKLIWDNSFSWFTSKSLRYRLSVLKPISQIDLERSVDFEQLRNQIRRDSDVNQNANFAVNNPDESNLDFILNLLNKKFLTFI